jgi:hypothetical protein
MLLDEIADPGGRNAPASARAVNLPLSKMFNFALPREVAVTSNWYLPLIRSGGHLPKGEYDGHHGGHEGQADPA